MTSAQKEYYYTIILLLTVYLIFSLTAFIKVPSLWGINFLYYLPVWVKILFIGIGSIVFLPKVNKNFYGLYQWISDRVSKVQKKTRRWSNRVIYVLIVGAFFGALFYYFRVFSIYHGTMAAIFILERPYTSIMDYYVFNPEMKNRILLILGYFPIIKYVFYNFLNLGSYWTLAFSSIIVGVIFVILLDYLVRALKINPFCFFFIFVLIFTQAITYSFFGVANFYTPVYVSTLLYLLLSILYFKNALSIVYPVFAGIFALLFHFGNEFILPSMMFLIIHRFRDKMTILYNLFSFKPIWLTTVLLLIILILPNTLMQYNIFNVVGVLPENIKILSNSIIRFSDIFRISELSLIGNKFLLSSPIGIILFIVLFRYIRQLSIGGEIKYYLFWLSIGGVLHIIFFKQLTFYDWDAFAWASIGYVMLGGLLYLHHYQKLKSFGYLSTIIITHALMYFTAWITLNNNVQATILNFLDFQDPMKYPDAISTCLKVLSRQNNDSLAITNILKKLEPKIKNGDDYAWLLKNYENLNDVQNHFRIYAKARLFLTDEIKKEPNNYYNYLSFLYLLSDKEKEDPNKRSIIEPFYKKIIQLKPKPGYYGDYSKYLANLKDYYQAVIILKKADSLTQVDKTSSFLLPFSHKDIKIDLARLNYLSGNYSEAVKYFNEAVKLGADSKDKNFDKALRYCIFSYIAVKNFNKAKDMLVLGHQNGVSLELNIDLSKQIIQSLEEKDYINFFRLFGSLSSDDIFRGLINFENIAYNEILPHTNNFILQNKFDSLEVYGEQMIFCAPDLYPGYYLLGVYNKNFKKDYASADSLFDKAIEKIKKSEVLDDVNMYVQRLEQIKRKR